MRPASYSLQLASLQAGSAARDVASHGLQGTSTDIGAKCCCSDKRLRPKEHCTVGA